MRDRTVKRGLGGWPRSSLRPRVTRQGKEEVGGRRSYKKLGIWRKCWKEVGDPNLKGS